MIRCDTYLHLPRYEEEIIKIIEAQGAPRFMSNGAEPVAPDGKFEIWDSCHIRNDVYLLEGHHIVWLKGEKSPRKYVPVEIIAKIPHFHEGEDIFAAHWEWWIFKEIEIVFNIHTIFDICGGMEGWQIHYNPWKAEFYSYVLANRSVDYTLVGYLPKKWKMKIPPLKVLTNPKFWDDWELEPE